MWRKLFKFFSVRYSWNKKFIVIKIFKRTNDTLIWASIFLNVAPRRVALLLYYFQSFLYRNFLQSHKVMNKMSSTLVFFSHWLSWWRHPLYVTSIGLWFFRSTLPVIFGLFFPTWQSTFILHPDSRLGVHQLERETLMTSRVDPWRHYRK